MKFRKRTDGTYTVQGCVVPHGRDTHWDSECPADAGLGTVAKVESTSLGARGGLVTETLWQPISGETGEPIKTLGDAGGGLYYTREAAGQVVVRDAAAARKARA